MKTTEAFSIAGVRLRVHFSKTLAISEEFAPFLSDDPDVDWDICFSQVPEFPQPEKQIFRNYTHVVCETGGEDKFARYFCHGPDADQYYACAFCDESKRMIKVQYLAEKAEQFADTHNAFSCVGFEEILLNMDRLILHASLVDTSVGGLLFSGPSGIGKSTQADLWRKYEGARLINGDRPILSKEESGWSAWGSPYAGSSRCYVNERVPIRAIVMLEQGSKCRLSRMGAADAFRKLYAGTVINTWNKRYVTKTCELLMDMAASVPVYRFVCTADQIAVETLKRELQEGVG